MNRIQVELVDPNDVDLIAMYENQFKGSLQKEPFYDSGFDLFTPQDVVCLAGRTTKIKLGVKVAMLRGTSEVSCGYYMYPRSSISKTPLRLANSVGIIDSGYRGELMAVVDNKSDEDYVVARGQRLFQVCAGDLSPITQLEFTTLNTTSRGSGGFGSTGM